MDDIYGNLENYNEVNDVNELRKENEELKNKLQQYAESIDKIQKDFDKLSEEHRKLEVNYSSLLKTARAEIERKTLLITNLNIEKDQLIIKSLNSHKNILNVRSNYHLNKDKNPGKSQTVEYESKKKKPQNISTNIYSKEREKDKTKYLENQETDCDGKNETKENIKDPQNTQPKSPPKNIRNRRKSMPAFSCDSSKFNPDEDVFSNTSKPTCTRYDASRSEDTHMDHMQNHKKPTKLYPEERRFDESRESYYRRMKHGRNYGSERDRYRDCYKSTFRSKRHFSPERISRRNQREYNEEQYNKNDHRPKALESPPSNKYERRHTRDLHSNESYIQSKDRQPLKHKIYGDYNEPEKKKLKTEVYHQPETHRNLLLGHKPLTRESSQNLDNLESCLSPDYISDENHTAPSVRIISDTPLTKLNDPRLTCDKYEVYPGATKCPSTKVGRNVDLKTVDKTVWNLEEIKLPEALRKPPSDYTDSRFSEGSESLEHVANISVESGEILDSKTTDTDFHALTKNVDIAYADEKKENCLRAAFNNKSASKFENSEKNIFKEQHSRSENEICRERSRTKEINVRKDKDTSQQKTKCVTEDINIKITDKDTTQPKNAYPVMEDIKSDFQSSQRSKKGHSSELVKKIAPDIIIHKSKATKEASRRISNRKSEIKEDSNEKDAKIKGSSKSIADNNVRPKDTLETKQLNEEVMTSQSFEIQKSSSKPVIGNKSAQNKQKKKKEINQINENKLTPIELIEKDLELSDETSCNIDSFKSLDNQAENDNEHRKKQKTKRKSHKNEETNPKCVKTVTSSEILDKEKPKLSKLIELFGESSSLITPDDLDIVTVDEPTSKTKYIPFYEDTQDAIDLNREYIASTMDSNLSQKSNVQATAVDKNNSEIIQKHNQLLNVETKIHEPVNTITIGNFKEKVLKNDVAPCRGTENMQDNLPYCSNQKQMTSKNADISEDLKSDMHQEAAVLIQVDNEQKTDTDVYKDLISLTEQEPAIQDNETNDQKSKSEECVIKYDEDVRNILSHGKDSSQKFNTNVYINLNTDEDAKKGVVKTVIISSGDQSKNLTTETNVPLGKLLNAENIDNGDGICALATSTPFKSNSTSMTEIQAEKITDQSSTDNISNARDDNEVPDVRIFVKRRRRKTIRP